MRVVHYLNQFFGGVGGEDKAGMALEARDGAVGPGKLLEQLFGSDCQVVMTLVCGDNYAVENQEALTAAVLEKTRPAQADLFVAGPCFMAGRYGMAAGALCVAVQATLKIPVITAMAAENPGADLYREFMYIVDSGDNGAKMREVLTRMAALARKLTSHQIVGSPRQEGYLARGLIRDEFVDQTAGERLVDMVLK
ncbi:MAG TPA: glycine/betaine/sarcosine/D-proline family reductase selenoprotein B, partial [Candidatus Binatia bacterium]